MAACHFFHKAWILAAVPKNVNLYTYYGLQSLGQWFQEDVVSGIKDLEI